MKPIRLEIDGINSYASKQVIDFETLTSRGIFGIFGKTGSGKSTILDAMTLALYGNIARGTKEFINSNRDKASVFYTFELGLGSDRARYMVTRRFKKKEKSGKTSAVSDYVRLMSMDASGEYEVLADKVGEVNSQIKSILGLEESDFLKSVVLPQGRFGEFLSLTGKDRRNMLERIFNLEEYGTDLNISLARKKKSVNDQINIVQAKLAEYPDVTAQAYKDLGENIKDVNNELASSKNSLTEADKLYEEYREVYKLMSDKAKLDLIEKNLSSQREEMEFLRSRLETSRTYFGLEADIKKIEDLDAQLVKINQELNLADKNRKKLDEDMARESDILGQLESKIKDMRQDSDYKNRLREAYQLEVSKNQQEEDKAKQEALVSEDLTTSKSIEKSLEVKREELDKVEEKIGNIIDAIIEEEKIQLVSDDQLMEMNTSLHELASSLSKYEENEAKYKLLKDKSSLRQEEIAKLKKSLELLEKEIKDQKLGLDNMIKENTQVRIQDLAKDLKSILLDHDHQGQACPVCGSKIVSLDYQAMYDIDLDAYKMKIDQAQVNLEKLIDHRDQMRLKLGKLEVQLSLEEEEIKVLEEDLGKKDLGELRSVYKSSKDQLDRERSLKSLKEREIAKLNKEKDQVHRDKLEIEKDINNLTIDLESRKSRIEVYKSNISGLDESIENIDSRLSPLKLGLGVDSLEEVYQDMQKKEEAFDSLSKNIQAQIDKLEDLKSKERVITQVYNELSKDREVAQGMKATILSRQEFKDIDRIREESLTRDDYDQALAQVEDYDKKVLETSHSIKLLSESLGGRSLDEAQLVQQEEICKKLTEVVDHLKDKLSRLSYQYKKMGQDLDLVASFKKNLAGYQASMDSILELEKVLRGNKFVEYLAQIYLQNIVHDASQRLDLITNGRYALEIDGDYAFVIRDNYKGGLRRSADTLSGGENFLTSLALALTLSSQIQLKGSAPLEFFFLDEGFGSLDRDLLDTVMNSLEKLQGQNMSVGIISHVEELKNMIPVRLEVEFDELESSSKVKLSW